MIDLPTQFYSIDPRVQFLVCNMVSVNNSLLELSLRKDADDTNVIEDIKNGLSKIINSIEKLCEVLNLPSQKFDEIVNSVENENIKNLSTENLTPFIIIMCIFSGKILQAENEFHFTESGKEKFVSSIVTELVHICKVYKRIKEVFGY